MEPKITKNYAKDTVDIKWEDREQSVSIYELSQATYVPIIDAVIIVGHEEIIIVPCNKPEVFKMWTR